MMNKVIWRDDDVLMYETLDLLLCVDDVFQKYGVAHSLGVIVKSLENHPALVSAIIDRKMEAQLHGYWHDDFSDGNVVGLKLLAPAVELMTGLLGVRPTVMYPPWNRTSRLLEEYVRPLGLRNSNQYITLQHYIRHRGHVPAGTVINFHYWQNSPALIEQALKIYTGQ